MEQTKPDGAAPALALVVDDDEPSRALLADLLGDEGYEVLTAPDGAAALTLLSQQRPAVILLDLVMPGMDGFAFARAYRRLPGPHAPIIIVTASDAAAAHAAEVAPAAVLRKPFDVDTLTAAVRAACTPCSEDRRRALVALPTPAY